MVEAEKVLTAGDQFRLVADPQALAEYFIFSNDAQILEEQTGKIIMDVPKVFFKGRLAAIVQGNTWEASKERKSGPVD